MHALTPSTEEPCLSSIKIFGKYQEDQVTSRGRSPSLAFASWLDQDLAFALMCAEVVKAVYEESRKASDNLVLQYNDRGVGFSNQDFRLKTDMDIAIPQFVPTTSPDINNLLKEWRHKVFTPSVLAAHQQALIYKKSRHHILNNDPGVTVTLSNDEDVKLEPMDRWDKPNKVHSLTEFARLLGASADGEIWANLIPFMEGMKTAKYAVPTSWREKITRKANEQGKQGIIIQSAQMVRKTDMRLSIKGVTRELLLGCHNRAMEAGLTVTATEDAVKFARRVILMLEDSEHCGGDLPSGHVDMRRDQFVFGVLLELTAAHAIRSQNIKDVDGEVAKLVNKILLFARANGSLITSSESTANDTTQQRYSLEDAIILYNAVELALKVDMKQSLGKDNTMKTNIELKNLSSQLKKEIDGRIGKFAANEKGSPVRALKMWQDVQNVQKGL